MRLMRFCFVILHVRCKDLVIADALSGASPAQPSTTDENFSKVEAYLNTILQTLPTADLEKVASILHHQRSDKVCQQLEDEIPGPIRAIYERYN